MNTVEAVEAAKHIAHLSCAHHIPTFRTMASMVQELHLYPNWDVLGRLCGDGDEEIIPHKCPILFTVYPGNFDGIDYTVIVPIKSSPWKIEYSLWGLDYEVTPGRLTISSKELGALLKSGVLREYVNDGSGWKESKNLDFVYTKAARTRDSINLLGYFRMIESWTPSLHALNDIPPVTFTIAPAFFASRHRDLYADNVGVRHARLMSKSMMRHQAVGIIREAVRLHDKALTEAGTRNPCMIPMEHQPEAGMLYLRALLLAVEAYRAITGIDPHFQWSRCINVPSPDDDAFSDFENRVKAVHEQLAKTSMTIGSIPAPAADA